MNNPFMTYYKNIISIIPLNQNQREIQADPIIPDKLTSNSTLGNIRGNPHEVFILPLMVLVQTHLE